MVYTRNLSQFTVDEKKEHLYHAVLGFVREKSPRYKIILQDDASGRLKISINVFIFTKATAYLDVAYHDKGATLSIRTEKNAKNTSIHLSDYTLSDRHTALEMDLRSYLVRQGFECDYNHHDNNQDSPSLAECTAKIFQTNSVSPDDILQLGKALYNHDVPTDSDIQTLFDIQQKCGKKCEEWNLFFTNAVSVYYAYHTTGKQNLPEEKERELIARIEGDHHIDAQTELRILINMINYLKQPSHFFKNYVLTALKKHILDGIFSLYGQDAPRENAISMDDLEALKLVVYGNNDDRHNPVSCDEIALLFDLDRQTNAMHNVKEWNHFFTKALTHYVTTAHQVEPIQEKYKRFQNVKDHFTSLSQDNRLSDHHHSALSQLTNIDSSFSNFL